MTSIFPKFRRSSTLGAPSTTSTETFATLITFNLRHFKYLENYASPTTLSEKTSPRASPSTSPSLKITTFATLPPSTSPTSKDSRFSSDFHGSASSARLSTLTIGSSPSISTVVSRSMKIQLRKKSRSPQPFGRKSPRVTNRSWHLMCLPCRKPSRPPSRTSKSNLKSHPQPQPQPLHHPQLGRLAIRLDATLPHLQLARLVKYLDAMLLRPFGRHSDHDSLDSNPLRPSRSRSKTPRRRYQPLDASPLVLSRTALAPSSFRTPPRSAPWPIAYPDLLRLS